MYEATITFSFKFLDLLALDVQFYLQVSYVQLYL